MVMPDTTPSPPPAEPAEPKLKIYFLPNLLTAGNLFCGFVALTRIVEADLSTGDFQQIELGLVFILQIRRAPRELLLAGLYSALVAFLLFVIWAFDAPFGRSVTDSTDPFRVLFRHATGAG